MDQNIGKMLDNRYEILELIGVGGMAKVYKARCHRLNRLVAVKILRDDLAQDSEFRRRFHDESQAVAMLSHPNIVAVYDVSRSGDADYIVMELIDGVTLKQYMQKKGNKLNWREALHFITQIVKALGHAHSRGIIHRDIKPHNVMVLRDGSVKVADFGIARLTSAGHSTLTQEALGSVHYISPEQARGSHIDARSDIYSAGVVLYEMITGRLPFEGDSPVSVAIQHINSIPLSPRELNPEIPEALEAITMKAMAPKADDRYASAAAMLADLEEFRKNPDTSFNYPSSDLKFFPEDAQELTRPVTLPPQERVPRPTDRPRRSARYEEERSSRAQNLPIYFAIVAIIAFTVGVFFLLYNSFLKPIFAPTPDYTIPTLTGHLLEEVGGDRALLGQFTVTVSSYVVSNEPEGMILRQTPAAESVTKDARQEISVTVSKGPEVIEMPDVTDWEYAQALVTLKNLGLSVPMPTYEADEVIKENHVISFTPLAKTQVRPGDEVQLVVSTGPTPKVETVPLFIGQTEEWARNKLALQNLEVGEVILVWSSEYPAGVVVDQSIAAYTEVAQGTKINLQVSKGVDPSTVIKETPKETTKTFSIALPDTQSIVRVTVMDGEEQILDQTVDTTMEAVLNCTVTGSGTKTYDIYFDGVAKSKHTVNFGD